MQKHTSVSFSGSTKNVLILGKHHNDESHFRFLVKIRSLLIRAIVYQDHGVVVRIWSSPIDLEGPKTFMHNYGM